MTGDDLHPPEKGPPPPPGSRTTSKIHMCPACQEGSLPAPGKRCDGVHGVRCSVRRCSCGAACQGLLRCPDCDGLLPVELVMTMADLEADEGPRGANQPATRTRILVDVGGSNSIWVSGEVWSRAKQSTYATRAILQAAHAVNPVVNPDLRSQNTIVGRYRPTTGEGEVPATLDRLTLVGRLDDRAPKAWQGRLFLLSVESSTPWGRIDVPKPRIPVDVEKLIDVLAALTPGQAIEDEDNGGKVPDELRPQHARMLLAQLLEATLVRWARPRLDILDHDAYRLSKLLEQRELDEGRRRFWTAAEVDGRVFCGGSACPGLGWHASQKYPHPTSCLAPGEDHRHVLEVSVPGLRLIEEERKGSRLAIDLGYRPARKDARRTARSVP